MQQRIPCRACLGRGYIESRSDVLFGLLYDKVERKVCDACGGKGYRIIEVEEKK